MTSLSGEQLIAVIIIACTVTALVLSASIFYFSRGNRRQAMSNMEQLPCKDKSNIDLGKI